MGQSFLKYFTIFILLIFYMNMSFADKTQKKEKTHMAEQQYQQIVKNKKSTRSRVIYVPYIYYYPYSPNKYPTMNYYQTNYYNTPSSPLSFSYPKGEWIKTSNGSFPEYAIVYQDTGQFRIYYCRVEYEDQIIYGLFIENDACYINDNRGNKLRLDEYEILKESD